MNDLFGVRIDEDPPKLTKSGKPKRDHTPKGYAARPGSGPVGETCGTCRHAAKNYRFWKCRLLFRSWTHSYGTDIRLKTPACSQWASKLQIDPDGRRL